MNIFISFYRVAKEGANVVILAKTSDPHPKVMHAYIRLGYFKNIYNIKIVHNGLKSITFFLFFLLEY